MEPNDPVPAQETNESYTNIPLIYLVTRLRAEGLRPEACTPRTWRTNINEPKKEIFSL